MGTGRNITAGKAPQLLSKGVGRGHHEAYRKNAAHYLGQARGRFEVMFSNAPIGMALLDSGVDFAQGYHVGLPRPVVGFLQHSPEPKSEFPCVVAPAPPNALICRNASR
jgi:hypothetical protein